MQMMMQTQRQNAEALHKNQMEMQKQNQEALEKIMEVCRPQPEQGIFKTSAADLFKNSSPCSGNKVEERGRGFQSWRQLVQDALGAVGLWEPLMAFKEKGEYQENAERLERDFRKVLPAFRQSLAGTALGISSAYDGDSGWAVPRIFYAVQDFAAVSGKLSTIINARELMSTPNSKESFVAGLFTKIREALRSLGDLSATDVAIATASANL